ncbi:MAG TPA: hypothetical protein VJ385_13890 [Fibrobacteria bacterium]|nr:hypothetical protein [Fibrobacteria bacterium]
MRVPFPAALPLSAGLLPSIGLLLSACDTRKPIDTDDSLIRPPILELMADKEAIGVDNDTSLAVRALLVNAFHGTLGQRDIEFTARIGFIVSKATTNDSGIASVLYYTRNRNLAATAHDTLTASFTYDGPDGGNRVTDTLVLRLIPGAPAQADVVGSIELSTSRTAVQVKGSGTTDQAVISARVFDINRARVKDGTKVTFRILSGPGGGETLGNGATDTASTKDGTASVTFHGGTSIGVVEIQASSGGQSIKQSLFTVTSGPPEHIDITVRPDSLATAGNRWRVEVQAALTDAYLNPVKDSIGVLFSLGAGIVDPSAVSVQGSGFTGNLRCKDTTQAACKAVFGSAFSYVSYRSDVVYDTLTLNAETSTGNRPIRTTISFQAPLQKPGVKVEYVGGALKISNSEYSDSTQLVGTLTDGFGYLVPGATLCISATSGEAPAPCQVTDINGKAYFKVIVDRVDNTELNGVKPITVTLTESRSGALGTTSFTVIFE